MKKYMLTVMLVLTFVATTLCGCDSYTLSEMVDTAQEYKTAAEQSNEATVTTETRAKNAATEKATTEEETDAKEKTEASERETKNQTDSDSEIERTEQKNKAESELFAEDTQSVDENEYHTPPYISDRVYSDMELEVFELINQERVKAGVAPLRLSYEYSDMAYIRACEADVVWSHTRPNGESFDSLVYDFNLQDEYLLIGENLASGMQTAEQMMDGLMNSSGHRENILRPQYTAVSVAIVPMSEYPDYYVLAQIFVHDKYNYNQV